MNDTIVIDGVTYKKVDPEENTVMTAEFRPVKLRDYLHNSPIPMSNMAIEEVLNIVENEWLPRTRNLSFKDAYSAGFDDAINLCLLTIR